MSQVEIPEGMRVWYQHARRVTFIGSQKVVDPRGGHTRALLFNIADDPRKTKPVATGITIVNPKDNYNKRIGRMIALGRALTALRLGIPTYAGPEQPDGKVIH